MFQNQNKELRDAKMLPTTTASVIVSDLWACLAQL